MNLKISRGETICPVGWQFDESISMVHLPGEWFVAVYAISGGRTATRTCGFDIQHGVSY